MGRAWIGWPSPVLVSVCVFPGPSFVQKDSMLRIATLRASSMAGRSVHGEGRYTMNITQKCEASPNAYVREDMTSTLPSFCGGSDTVGDPSSHFSETRNASTSAAASQHPRRRQCPVTHRLCHIKLFPEKWPRSGTMESKAVARSMNATCELSHHTGLESRHVTQRNHASASGR
jgi:hypothetical protein